MQINSPFSLDQHGQVALADDAQHVRQMIMQVLFTAQGERVNLPDFGCGLDALVFETASSEMVGIKQAMIRGALLRWLGSVIRLDDLEVQSEGERLRIHIAYTVLSTGARGRESFQA
jgi:phage baseplate assembly protein W